MTVKSHYQNVLQNRTRKRTFLLKMYVFVKIIIYKVIVTSVLPFKIGSIGTLHFSFTFD
jgi:hypothetical protein